MKVSPAVRLPTVVHLPFAAVASILPLVTSMELSSVALTAPLLSDIFTVPSISVEEDLAVAAIVSLLPL